MSKMPVTLMQMNTAWNDPGANLKYIESELKKNKHGHLVILPEMFNTGYSMDTSLAETMDGETVQTLVSLSQSYRCIITGSLMISDGDNYYNRLLWVQPDGVVHVYDKRHLFSMAHEQVHFRAGEEKILTSVNGWKFLPQICYDLRFPVWLRNTEDYDVLIFVANWPSSRIAHWTKLLVARAIENQCYVVAVNRCGTDPEGIQYDGHSMIVDPRGEILQEVIGKSAIIHHSLDKEVIIKTRKELPFLDDRDKFMLL